MLFSVIDSVLLGYVAASLCNQTLTSRGDVVFDLQRSRHFQDRALRTWVRIPFAARLCISIFVCFGCPVSVDILRQAEPTSKENFQMPTNKIQKPGELGSCQPRLADVPTHRYERQSRVYSIHCCCSRCLCLRLRWFVFFYLFILFSKTVRWTLALTQPRMNNWHFFPRGKAGSSAEGKWVELYLCSHYLPSWLRRDFTFASARVIRICCESLLLVLDTFNHFKP